MHLDPLLPKLVAATFTILLIGWVLRRLRQPHVIAYLTAGVILGPHGLGIFTNEVMLARLGEAGVVLLLFFVGMEVSLDRLLGEWKVATVGTLLQIAASLGCVAVIGAALDWPVSRILLLGFAISLSSTAVVVSLLRSTGDIDTRAGREALGILLVQDLALIPMLMVIGLLGGTPTSGRHLAQQVVGAAAIVLLVILLARAGSIRLPFGSLLTGDHELQVFAALLICFGFAVATGQLGLSVAVGAFVAGIVVGAARETDWVSRSLDPFRVIFVALFFVSVGMLIDPPFLTNHWQLMLLLTAAALATNTLVNAGILRVMGRRWQTSLYMGALLAQIGEFSFLLAAVGRDSGIITDFAYQITVGVIALTLLISPLWIALARPLRPFGAA